MTSKIFTWLTQARATQFCRKKMHSNQRNLLIKYYIPRPINFIWPQNLRNTKKRLMSWENTTLNIKIKYWK